MGQRERERERPSVVRALSLASCNLLLPRHDLPLAGSLRVGLSAPFLLSDGRRGIINRRRGPMRFLSYSLALSLSFSLSFSLSLSLSRCLSLYAGRERGDKRACELAQLRR